MPEMLRATSSIVGYGIKDSIAFITDGRFSGGSHGFIIGHVSPEAYDGGPIALIENGDLITIDSTTNQINHHLSDDIIKERFKKWVVPKDIINLVREKKLRLIISADREGGGMIFEGRDGFKATTDAMQQCNLPAGSILIIQGNSKIEDQYNIWLSSSGQPRLFEVKYSNHFDKIFINSQIPTEPIVCESMITQDVKDFNSLNRTYKSHRSAHLYVLAVNEP
jgi:hypothetical protein